MKILAVGDMHLGRTPSRLAAGAARAGSRPRRRLATDRGCRPGARGAGGAARRGRRRPGRRFLRGVSGARRRRAEAGRRGHRRPSASPATTMSWCCPRLARHIPRFRLLGGGGKWESCRVGDGDGGGNAVTLWGWSFPATPGPREPPCGPVHRPPAPGINLGLLHCDRGRRPRFALRAGRSSRARARGPRRLAARSYPQARRADRRVAERIPGQPDRPGPRRARPPGTPGRSPSPMGVSPEVDHLPLAPLRWEPLEVDLTGIGEPADARERLLTAVIDLDGTLASLRTAPDAVGLSVALIGRTGFGSAALERISPGRARRDSSRSGRDPLLYRECPCGHPSRESISRSWPDVRTRWD